MTVNLVAPLRSVMAAGEREGVLHRREMLDHVAMALLVEIHVPLPAGAVEGLAEEEHPIVWIEEIEDFLERLDTAGEIEVFDDGEEYGEVYIFFISGADEKTLLAAASRVAVLDAVPAGAFAMVTDDEAEEFGMGRRIDLPVS